MIRAMPWRCMMATWIASLAVSRLLVTMSRALVTSASSTG